MLQITNGDTTADKLSAAGLPGQIVPWRDVLHEGPVPAGRSPAELRAVRAGFIAAQGWADEDAVLRDFAARDAALSGAHDEIVLWFEHDLYDQLQLLQVLDRLSDRDLRQTSISLIAIDRVSGADPFHGLGQLSTGQLAALFPGRQAVHGDQPTLARKVWRAFGAAEPTGLNRLAQMHYPALPHLRPALVRLLEHYPATGDGLTRTERQVLTALAGGAQIPADLFALDRAAEPAPFLGDLVFWHVLATLASGDSPLIAPLDGAMPPPADPRFAERPVRLTALGRATLAGQADWVEQGGIDRWLGGVHLRGRSIGWRWDRARSTVVAV